MLSVDMKGSVPDWVAAGGAVAAVAATLMYGVIAMEGRLSTTETVTTENVKQIAELKERDKRITELLNATVIIVARLEERTREE